MSQGEGKGQGDGEGEGEGGGHREGQGQRQIFHSHGVQKETHILKIKLLRALRTAEILFYNL